MRLLVAGSLVLGYRPFSCALDYWTSGVIRKIIYLFLAYAILGFFSVQFFFYLCVEYSNATTATILQFISPVFILFYNRIVYQKRPRLQRFSMF